MTAGSGRPSHSEFRWSQHTVGSGVAGVQASVAVDAEPVSGLAATISAGAAELLTAGLPTIVRFAYRGSTPTGNVG
jgi:hypothetical protein